MTPPPDDRGDADGGADAGADDRDDGPDDGPDDDGPDDAAAADATAGPAEAGRGKRKRRRRRRRGAGDPANPNASIAADGSVAASPPTGGDATTPAAAPDQRPQRTYQPREQQHQPRRDDGPARDDQAQQPQQARPRDPQPRGERGPHDPQSRGERGPRDPQPRGERGPHDPQSRGERGPHDPQSRGERGPQDPQPRGERGPQDPQSRGERGPQDPQSRGDRDPQPRGERGPQPRGERGPQPRGERGPRAPQPRGERGPRAPNRSRDGNRDRNGNRDRDGARDRGRTRITGSDAGSDSDSETDSASETDTAAGRDTGRRGAPGGSSITGTIAQAALAAAGAPVSTASAGMPRVRNHDRAPDRAADDDVESTGEQPTVAWGTEDDTPAPAVELKPDLPTDAAGDPDPITAQLPPSLGPGRDGGEVASLVGVRYVANGRVSWCDAGGADFHAGERVMVDSDRGPRLAWIAAPPVRRLTRDRGLRRVIRHASDIDLRGERDGDDDRARVLRAAKDVAERLRLALKVFRVELQGGRGGKLFVYYTSDERLDLRDFMRELGAATNARIELRQLGTRDEAKAVGGIGSCGLTLCCTTWMPEFVPVSIKMAKDQGLSLAPSKVMGQCGRLKCCLVYEQAGYAELRKGLPKLGKRVLSARGEGRVVEVDVLRQRIRVSYGMGDSEVLPAAEVKPLFPPGNQPSGRPGSGQPDHADDDDRGDEPDPTQLPVIRDAPSEPEPEPEDDTPTDDPSAH